MSGGGKRDELPPEVWQLLAERLGSKAPGLAAVVRIDALLEAGRSGDAVDAARRALAERPDDVILLGQLAEGLVRGERFAQAQDAARRALALEPERVSALRTLAAASFGLGDEDEAAAVLDRAVALDPADHVTLAMAGEVTLQRAASVRNLLSRSELVERAEQLAGEVLRLRPDEADGYVLLARTSVLRRDGRRAAELARRALAIDPEHVAGREALGLAEQLTGNAGAAADHFVAAGRLAGGGSSLALLRRMRMVPVTALLGAMVATIVAGALVGPLAALAVAVTLAAILWWTSRWVARRSMSPTAHAVLERDGRMGGG